MENFVSSLISATSQAIFDPCLDCTCKRMGYISKLEDSVDSLKKELQKLVEAKEDVQGKVKLAEQRPQMKVLSTVQGWLSRVEEQETEVSELLRHSSQEIQKLCLGGYCSKKFKSSYKFGKKVAKKLQVVVQLRSEGGAFEEVAGEVPEPAVHEIPLEPTIVGLQPTFDELWKCLGEGVRIVSIYGPAGVGKTTLLKQINNKFVYDLQGFGVVIWVTVSRVPNLETLQEDIGKKIGLNDESWKKRSLQEKALDIFRILSNKKFVLLLDDIWNRIDLTELGVPMQSSKLASKIVFTTRFFNVCGSMKSEKSFKVEYLRDEEAWKLFEVNLLRDILDSDPEILPLAEAVAKECGGLPLALVTISRAMSSKKTPQEWRHAAYVLRNSASKFEGMETQVFGLLKFSYDSLPSDQIRSCLLYCSLYPEDFWISKIELIEHWIGEDILNDCDTSEVYDLGYDIIGTLVRACLLEEENVDYESEGSAVKMHDVIRDMVLWIVDVMEKEKENYLVKAGMGLTEAPEVGKWVGVKRISLMKNKIRNLSQTPKCPHLQTLFLNRNDLKTINDDFFEFMPSLKVLNLSNNLNLTKIPLGVSKLVSLQYLNLSHVLLVELPVELKALINLKCLNLEFMFFLQTIPRQLIANLQRLHTLRMYRSGYMTAGRSMDNFFLEELGCLEYLNVLTITLGNFNALQRLLSSVKLESCTETLELTDFTESEAFNIAALATLKRLHQLELNACRWSKIEYAQRIRDSNGFYRLRDVSIVRCTYLTDLTWIVFIPNLRRLFVRLCNMEEIINVEKLGEVASDLIPFQKLQFLRLQSLKNLKSISGKALPFSNLKKIKVLDCPMLRKLPLDSNSAKEHKNKIIIAGEESWWKGLQWEDEATLNAFLPCFNPVV